jgi:hypothetical protein
LFALLAIPMHWMYYWYNGLAFVMGLGGWMAGRRVCS